MRIELTVEEIADVLRGAPINTITDDNKMVIIVRKAILTQEERDALNLGRGIVDVITRMGK